MSLTDAEKTANEFGPCRGCQTWHLWSCLKRAKGFFWCVLCYPSPMEEKK